MQPVPLTVVIPTYKRIGPLEIALRKILACSPPPAQVLVHIDNGDTVTRDFLAAQFPQVETIFSPTQVGPGGGRNRLTAAAAHEIVCSFDDDSYPIDAPYFQWVEETFRAHPEFDLVGSTIFHRGEKVPDLAPRVFPSADFTGCGVSYRKSKFLQTAGYLPLALAYGAEESDLCIQFVDRDFRIVTSHGLRVFHDTDLAHHNRPEVTEASIANLMLLAFLRYPIVLFPIAIYQVVNRILWLFLHHRRQGLGKGVRRIFPLIRQFREHRRPVRAQSLLRYFRMRKKPAAEDR